MKISKEQLSELNKNKKVEIRCGIGNFEYWDTIEVEE